MKNVIITAIALVSMSCNSQIASNKSESKMEIKSENLNQKNILTDKNSIESLLIVYEETKNIDKQLQQVPEAYREQLKQQIGVPTAYLLTVNGKISLYEMQENDKKNNSSDDLQQSSNIKLINIGAKSRTYKNSETIQYLKETSLLGKEFLITDVLNKIDWKLSNDSKKIGNNECKKATAIIDESPVEAWYSSSIPLSDGPAEFWGLPGLIIELKTSNKYYLATKISVTKNIEITKPIKGKKVTKKEFEKARTESLEEIQNTYKTGN